MEFELLGWPADGVKLALDYREFSYAGKFVMSSTGKTVATDPAGESDADSTPAADVESVIEPDGKVLAAVAFNEDRTDADTAWLRYVTVRSDRRGEGIGPRLVSFTTDRLRERGYERIKIAVNNPFAYEALHRAGFAYTGEETGIAELVLAFPAGDRSREPYQAGLDTFRQRDPDIEERDFLDRKRGADPPEIIGDH